MSKRKSERALSRILVHFFFLSGRIRLSKKFQISGSAALNSSKDIKIRPCPF